MAWNRPNTVGAGGKSTRDKARNSVSLWLVTGLVAVAIAVILFLYGRGTSRDDANAARQKETRSIEESPVARRTKTQQDAVLPQSARPKSRTTKPTVSPSTPETPDEDLKAPKKPAATATDQRIAMMMRAMDGQSTPPIPGMHRKSDGTKEFLKSLETPIVIEESDSDYIREHKQRLIEMRAAIKQAIDEGASFNEILKEQLKISKENSKIRNEAMRELRQITEQGDMEGAKKYLNVMNTAFGQMGIQEIEMPLSFEERRARALEQYRLKHPNGAR